MSYMYTAQQRKGARFDKWSPQMMTFNDFKPNTDESEHSYPCLSSFYGTQVASRPTITAAVLLLQHAQIYTHVLQNSDKWKLTIVLGQTAKFK